MTSPCRLAALAGKRIPSEALFAELVAEAGHRRSCPGLATFTALVRRLFRAKCHGMDLVFPGGTQNETDELVANMRLNEWLHAHIIITGTKSGNVTISELWGAYKKCDVRHVPMASFKRLATAFLMAVPGVSFRSKTTVNGETIRNVFWRVRFE
jgi:hypothetical protein